MTLDSFRAWVNMLAREYGQMPNRFNCANGCRKYDKELYRLMMAEHDAHDAVVKYCHDRIK